MTLTSRLACCLWSALVIAVTSCAWAAEHPSAAAALPPADFFVAPGGDDAWSGTHEKGSHGDGPFATLARAQTAARQLTQARSGAGAVVQIAVGTYDLGSTLAFTAADSGSAAAPTIYRGAGAGVTVVRGGRVLGPAKPFRSAIVQFDLTGLALADSRPRQLFVRGQRQTPARYPNADENDPHGGTWGYVAAVDSDHEMTTFHYGSNERHHWSHPEDGQVAIYSGYDWAFSILPLASYSESDRAITLGKQTWCPLRVGDRYVVYGMMEDLDSPGEWYADPRTNTLYLWPQGPLSAGDAVVPAVANLLTMTGAAHIQVQGLTLDICASDAARIHACTSCALLGCEVCNCGGTGITVSGGSEDTVRGNHVHDCGEGGIAIDGGDRATLTPAHHLADNNCIHHCATWWLTYRPGVSINGVGNVISHNLIYDLPHAGITLAGNDNIAEYNIVHHVNCSSGDTGGIYFCSRDWTQRGNVIRYNLFHDIGGYGKANPWAPVKDGKVEYRFSHFTWGIYLDDPSTGCLVFGNILYDVPVYALHNHGGSDNTWENNIIVDCPAIDVGMLDPKWKVWPAIIALLHQALVPGSPYAQRYPGLLTISDTAPEAVTGVHFVRNIIYETIAGTKAQRDLHTAEWGGPQCEQLYTVHIRKSDFAQDAWDYNCVFAEPGLSFRVNLTEVPDHGRILTWTEWQAFADSHSLEADPRFENVAAHDFRLKPDSPALRLGFKPIPIERIGPYADAQRARWPADPASDAHQDEIFRQYYVVPPR